MKRREALKLMLHGIGLFTILPGAGRVWKAARTVEHEIYWFQSQCEARCFDSAYITAFRNFLEYNRLFEDHIIGVPSEVIENRRASEGW